VTKLKELDVIHRPDLKHHHEMEKLGPSPVGIMGAEVYQYVGTPVFQWYINRVAGFWDPYGDPVVLPRSCRRCPKDSKPVEPKNNPWVDHKGAPVKLGWSVGVVDNADEFLPQDSLGHVGVVVGLDYNGCGQEYPYWPLILVQLDNGVMDGFWPEELQILERLSVFEEER